MEDINDSELRKKFSKFGKFFVISNLLFIILSIVIISFNTLAIIERGPRFAFFWLFLLIISFTLCLILGLIWIRREKSVTAAKRTLGSVILVFIVVFSVMVYNNYQVRKSFQYIEVNGQQRQYLIHIPKSYTGSSEVPLVLGLHGGTGNAKQFMTSSGFNDVSDKYGFIMVYPDGVGPFEFSFHVWSSGYLTWQEYAQDDIKFLEVLIQQLIQDYEINESMVYMTGHSNGAMMTYRFAAERPSLVAAIAPLAGTIGGRTNSSSELWTIPNPSEPVSVIHIHGKQDTNVLYDGGVSLTGYNAGVRYDLSAKDAISFWVENNNCDDTPITENSTNDKIIKQTYPNGDNNTEVVLVTIQDQNHFWENINADVKEEQFYGDSLAEMIWNMLKVYKKD